jgi:hypothetical protein
MCVFHGVHGEHTWKLEHRTEGREATKEAVMLGTIGRSFPERRLHLVDIENLAAAKIPGLSQIREVQNCYAEHLTFGAFDQVVIASSHLTLLNAGIGWPHARYRVRSGPDGADLALLDVLLREDIAARFTHVAIGSGDGVFAAAAASLAASGVRVTVVSHRNSLSARLALAACEVIYLDSEPAAAAFY